LQKETSTQKEIPNGTNRPKEFLTPKIFHDSLNLLNKFFPTYKSTDGTFISPNLLKKNFPLKISTGFFICGAAST